MLTRDPDVQILPARASNSVRFGNFQATALGRWEGEGGAVGRPLSRRREKGRSPLSRLEVDILQCLGAAVLSQWNGLPTCIQQELFEHSSDAVTPPDTARLKRRIARFLHEHKDDVGGSK